MSEVRVLAQSMGLFVLRAGVGAMMIGGHGWDKLSNFQTKAPNFPDPLGLGSSSLNLALAISAEFFCSALLILGLLTRLATIPLICTMLVAALVVHAQDPWAKKELALLYLIPYLTLLLAGPGRFSLDALLFGRRKKNAPSEEGAP